MTADARGRDGPDKHTAGGADTARSPSRGTEQLLNQPVDSDSLYQLRASVAAHAVQAGLSRRRADDLVIAAHELAANVLRHGSGRGTLRLWRHDQALHCQVADDGTPWRAAGGARAEVTDPSSWRVQPGHGLWLIYQLADGVSLHPGQHGPAVTVSFALSPVASARAFSLAEHASGGTVELAVAGQLDHGSADRLTGAIERLLAADPAARIVVDLGGLTFWDAFGLAGLLRAQGRVEACEGASLMLADMPAPLAEHLRVTGLADRFSFAGTPQERTADDRRDDLSPPCQ